MLATPIAALSSVVGVEPTSSVAKKANASSLGTIKPVPTRAIHPPTRPSREVPMAFARTNPSTPMNTSPWLKVQSTSVKWKTAGV